MARSKKKALLSLPRLPAGWGVAEHRKGLKRAGKSGKRGARDAHRRVKPRTPAQRKKFLGGGLKALTKIVTSKSGRKYEKNLATGKSKPIPSHKKLTQKCVHCGKNHPKGLHRFHGKGSYERTHPGAFGRTGKYKGYAKKMKVGRRTSSRGMGKIGKRISGRK